MIELVCIGHKYEYEVRELLKLFFRPDNIKLKFIEKEEEYRPGNRPDSREDLLVNQLHIVDNMATAISSFKGDRVVETSPIDKGTIGKTRLCKNLVKKSIFKLLKQETDIKIPWGILTGIRPTKIVHELLTKGYREEEILETLIGEYCIDRDKAILLIDIAKVEHRFVYPIDESKISLYISIPFCPSRCLYCSFPSNSLGKSSHLLDDYVRALGKEIRGVGDLIRLSNKKVETIYIGGGTPTSLSLGQLEDILRTIKENIDLNYLKEFTVEAGRPDTISYEKLALLKRENVGRISINPQTMREATLKTIGRNHTVKDLVEAYRMAQELGFENINMDIIIGLPGENRQDLEHTMEEIRKLSPSNLTVHTLAIKRASKLRREEENHKLAHQKELMDMLKISQDYARAMGLRPYYMYRQKHMVGNLENIGYARPGFECIYNIQIMEEKQTIIGLGAGAVCKFTYPRENRLERVANVKGLGHYIDRVDEMIDRKLLLMHGP